jgi:DNA-binding MarR family transcriptional regulator
MTTDLYPLAQEAMRAMALHYDPAMQQVIADAGLEGPGWRYLFLALGAEPRPLTVAHICRLAPYTSPRAIEARLANLASRELLVPVEGGAYRLAETGRRAVLDAVRAAHVQMATLAPLPADELRRLIDLLCRLVDSALGATEPAEKELLISSRLMDPGEDAPLTVRVDQYLTDLTLYRDDVHPAVWRRHEISGQAWEALTLIWRGEAESLETLTQKLENRGATQASYVAALQELIARGWIAEQVGTYRLTESGQAVRQEAEDATNRLFYAPWACLSEDESRELQSLLTRLRDSLTQTSSS